MSIGAIGADILGGGVKSTPPWYTSLKHPVTLGVNALASALFVTAFWAEDQVGGITPR